ncbi:hypothetical protein HBB16_06680 [Pseudonocardia sp. MCCB 268]|nr:hypothetical protein [Pseudonocardia cytotoxica]
MIEQLQGESRVVDGRRPVSTTPPRARQADLGLAMGTGTDVAIRPPTSPWSRRPAPPRTVQLARRTLGTIRATCSGRSPTTRQRSRAGGVGPAQR